MKLPDESVADALRACKLCPRACGSNRAARELGYCRAGLQTRLYRYGLHFGEEPPISGTCGSGTLFFAHCTLRCIYCQNYLWSQHHRGQDLAITGLSAVFRTLAEQGCHNWNLVSPTPWLPQIQEAVAPLLRIGIRVPFVYNTSGFEVTETLAEYSSLADIALVDLRYARQQTATEGSDAPHYADVARRTLLWFWNQLGPLKIDSQGVAQRGVICRLLALPNRVAEAVENLEWLAANLGNGLHISVMSQYTPAYRATTTETWNRRLQQAEYALLTTALTDLGFSYGWVQDFEEETSNDLLGQYMPEGEGTVGRVRDDQ